MEGGGSWITGLLGQWLYLAWLSIRVIRKQVDGPETSDGAVELSARLSLCSSYAVPLVRNLRRDFSHNKGAG